MTFAGDVASFRLTPDGQHAVYRADQTTDGVAELYSVPVIGGGNTAIIDSLVASGDVMSDFDITPDGAHVVYRADKDTNDLVEIYSVPIGGGTSVKLNSSLAVDGQVDEGFIIAPDSGRVVYRADAVGGDTFELFSSPIATGGAVKLNTALPDPFSDVDIDYTITPDSSRVIYRADLDTYQVNELYSRAIDGSGSQTKISGPLVLGGDVADLDISPDGSTVVFRADKAVNNRSELFAVSPTGGSATQVSGPFSAFPPPFNTAPNENDVEPDYEVASNNTHVVYRAPQDANGWIELYVAALDGSGDVKISPTMPFNPVPINFDIGVQDFMIAADSSRIAFRADTDGNAFQISNVLYSNTLDGTGLTQISATGDTVYNDFAIAPDNSTIIYRAEGMDGIIELFAAPLDGSATPTLLSGSLSAFEDVDFFDIMPDGSGVVFGLENTGGQESLYAVKMDASETILLDSVINSTDFIGEALITADSSYAVYTKALAGVVELYSVAISFSSDPDDPDDPDPPEAPVPALGLLFALAAARMARRRP